MFVGIFFLSGILFLLHIAWLALDKYSKFFHDVVGLDGWPFIMVPIAFTPIVAVGDNFIRMYGSFATLVMSLVVLSFILLLPRVLISMPDRRARKRMQVEKEKAQAEAEKEKVNEREELELEKLRLEIEEKKIDLEERRRKLDGDSGANDES